jgi:hypothetical protein
MPFLAARAVGTAAEPRFLATDDDQDSGDQLQGRHDEAERGQARQDLYQSGADQPNPQENETNTARDTRFHRLSYFLLVGLCL